VAFIEREIGRNSGKATVLYNDELGLVGSIRVWRPGLAEIDALGLLHIERQFKAHVCAPSTRWQTMSLDEARKASIEARQVGRLPIVTVAKVT